MVQQRGSRGLIVKIKIVLVSVLSLLAPYFGQSSVSAAKETKDVYIIKFSDSVNLNNEISALKSGGNEVQFEYKEIFKGAAVLMNSARAEALAKNPNVEIIERDGFVTTQLDQNNPPSWGLDRVDQLNLPLNNKYSYTNEGNGVVAYVVDTGISSNSKEFGSRLKTGFTAINDKRGTSDCNGHGTHVAGTIGSNSYGVAKAVELVPVRVLDCRGSGTWSQVISGIDWIASSRDVILKGRPAVANMSLGGGASSSVDAAVESLIQRGVSVVVAAGNSSVNACNASPAKAKNAITVGATTRSDSIASYSNFGSCVDLFAPGSEIVSTYITSRGSSTVATLSGTSMASPHVAGVVARLLQGGSQTPSAVASVITSTATAGVITGIGSLTGTPNLLLYRAPGS